MHYLIVVDRVPARASRRGGEMSRSLWAPFTLSWDDAPIDVSFVFGSEPPAGRHGFVTTNGDVLAFEDGGPARFWGVNVNGGANFPEPDQSERVARRLAKFGVNLVRCHQMDAEWSTPNLFRFNRAEPAENTRSLHPESMQRLDYFMACLKEQGIYVYLDLLTYRKFLPGDGVDAVDELEDGAAPYVYFDPRLIELQEEFNEQLWTHVNPHTGLAYKDDPVIALSELLNEADFWANAPVLEPYRSRLEKRYREWARGQGTEAPPETVDFTSPDLPMARFFGAVQTEYYRDMIAALRALGVKIPIAGTNLPSVMASVVSQAEADFFDGHAYWNFPHWDSVRGTNERPMVSSLPNAFRVGIFSRTLDKPFFLSEWDHAWPASWRAEAPLAWAAIGAFQGWGGLAIHAYRYTTHGPVDRIGGGGTTIDGNTYRRLFETFNDPAKFGLFYHAALLFRRADVRRGSQRTAIRVAEDPDGTWLLRRGRDLPAVLGIAELHLAGIALPGTATPSDLELDADEPVVSAEVGRIVSDTGEVRRDWERGWGSIDSPRTKAVYGFVGKIGPIELDGLELRIDTEFATVAVSSLTDDAIEDSTSLLLTAVGRCDNSDAQFDASHRWQVDSGRAPVMIEIIEGDVRLRTRHPGLKVWMIGERGEALAHLPAAFDEGWMRFRLGPMPMADPEDAEADLWRPQMMWSPQGTIYYLIGR
jgi:hypothetical protein